MDNVIVTTKKPTIKLTYLLVLLMLCLFTSTTNALSLTAEVDRTTLGINETLILTITLDKQGGDNIDFKDLTLQFDILNQQRSSQTSIVNGRISAKTQWALILAPKETGDLVVPSFSTEGVFSDAIRIQVTNSSNPNNSGSSSIRNPDVFLAARVDKSTAYVQEQILLTLELYYRISLSGYTPQDIALNNATVELVAENTIKKQHNGSTYNVLQKTYAIHPQASGTLNFPEQTWQIEKASRGFGFGQITSPYLRVRSLPVAINISPIPAASTAQHWIPTPQLTLEQQWQQSIITAQVGEPLTYSLTLEAEGLSYSQLPTIDLKSNENFTIYGDKAQTSNTANAEGIKGKRIENYAVIPKTAGTFTFPGATLRWWNIRTDTEESIRLPAQTIIVASSKISETPISPSTQQTPSGSQTSSSSATKSTLLWQLTTLAALLLALVFFLLWQRNLHPIRAQHTPTDLSERIEPNVKSIYTGIERAVAQKDWKLLKQQLLQWSSITSQTPIKSSQEARNYFPHLDNVLEQLDRCLYSGREAPPETKNLLKSLKNHQKTTKTHENNQDPLKPLYPK